jgi:uncharacterized protein YraI
VTDPTMHVSRVLAIAFVGAAVLAGAAAAHADEVAYLVNVSVRPG